MLIPEDVINSNQEDLEYLVSKLGKELGVDSMSLDAVEGGKVQLKFVGGIQVPLVGIVLLLLLALNRSLP